MSDTVRNANTSVPSILIAASEAVPLAKVGGLGDVVGSLPLALRDLGCRVAVILPGYRQTLMEMQGRELVAKDLPVSLGRQNLTADVLKGELSPGVPAYLVRRDDFFDREDLYGDSQGEYVDNRQRFIFFSRSVPVLCSALGLLPDVILGNDWQTGLVMALLAEGNLPGTAGVFAIHNMGYLGLVPADRTEIIGLPNKYYRMKGLKYNGQMSLLKAGIVYAQAVTTVSPTYAREIQTPDFGGGLDGLMRSASQRLHGILNGVDYRIWDPTTDRHLAANYSHRDLPRKRLCKQELLKLVGLPEELLDRPVAGVITRLVGQKGCDLLAEAAEDLFELGLGLILLGTGEERYQRRFSQLQARHPKHLGLKLGFDSILAHKIVGGCDMVLAPSLYEPCGLTTMFSLKYGTIPVVRATGGFQDTVVDPNDDHRPATGFKFGPFKAPDLIRAVHRAVETYQDHEKWQAMMLEAMSQDFSWQRAAKEYLAVFDRAIAARRVKKSD